MRNHGDVVTRSNMDVPFRPPAHNGLAKLPQGESRVTTVELRGCE